MQNDQLPFGLESVNTFCQCVDGIGEDLGQLYHISCRLIGVLRENALAHKEGDDLIHAVNSVGLQLAAEAVDAEREFDAFRDLGYHVVVKIVCQTAADKRRAVHIRQQKIVRYRFIV